MAVTRGVFAQSPKPEARDIKCLTIIQTELEFENAHFRGERKTGVPGGKPLGARTRTNNKLNPHMTPSQGIEPVQHSFGWRRVLSPLRQFIK